MTGPDQDTRERGKARAMELDAQARQAFEEGNYARSRQLFEQALEACREIGWEEEIIYGLLHVTQAMSFEPDYDPSIARPMLEEALQIAREIGTLRYILPVQINRVRIMIDAGEYAAGLLLARENLQDALDIADRNLVSSLLTFIAFALVGLGQAEAALRLFGSTEAERERQGVKLGEPFLTKIAQRLAPARNALRKEHQAAAEAEGSGLSLEAAVEYALSFGGENL